MRSYLLRLFVCVVALAVITLPDQATARLGEPGAGDISGVGKETSTQLFQYFSEEYEKIDTETGYYFTSLEESEAVSRLSSGKADYLILDSGEFDFAPAEVTDKMIMFPVIANAVVLVYNLPDIGGDLHLSREAYVGIFTGEIKFWDDERIARHNPDLQLPNMEITTVHRVDTSHTTRVLTRHLDKVSESWAGSGIGVGKSVDWPGNSMGDRKNTGVAMKVRRSHGSIGYVDFSTAMRGGMPMAVLENRSGTFTSPSVRKTEETIADLKVADIQDSIKGISDPTGENAYPIIAARWAVLPKQDADRIKLLKVQSFFEWILTEGQDGLESFGYSRLPDNVRKLALDELKKID